MAGGCRWPWPPQATPQLPDQCAARCAILAVTLFGALLLVSVTELSDSAVVRAVMLLTLGLLLFSAGRGRRWLRALLFTPILVLLVSHPGHHPPTLEYLQAAFLTCCAVFGVALLGQWLLWTIRPDLGHARA